MKLYGSLCFSAVLMACGGSSAPATSEPPLPPVPAAPAPVAPVRAPEPDARDFGPDAAGERDPARAALAANVEPLSELERVYVGEHALGVNRVTDQRRPGRVTIRKEGGVLRLEGSVAEGVHSLELAGVVQPVTPKRFYLDGELSGVPDMAWADEAPRARQTRGRFLFDVTKGRKFWRLYEIDGRECVCQDGCGNDFCYIDIELALR